MWWALVAAAVLATAAFLAWRHVRAPAPRLLASGKHSPALGKYAGGAWYWLQPVEPPYRTLCRVAPGAARTATELASADALSGYDVTERHVAWTAREGARWTVYLAAPDGSAGRAVWSSASRVGAPRLGRERLWWTAATDPAPAEDPGPYPPLEQRLRVLSAPLAGGPAVEAAVLLESGDGEVVGEADGTVYVAAARPEPPTQTCIYAVPARGGKARRIAGETGRAAPLLRADGALWWVGYSRESSNPAFESAVRRWSPVSGGAVTEQEWLPAPGRLYEVDGELVFAAADFRPALWSIKGPNGLPVRHTPPPGFVPLAAGEGGVLYQRPADHRGGPVYHLRERP